MSSNDIYALYNIDKSRLKRDYIKNPLYKGSGGCDKGDKPFKEDLEYLYIELNLKREILEQYFSRCSRTLKLWFKEYGIHKTQDLIIKNIGKTNLTKYGVPCVFQNKEIYDKSKETLFQRYGVYNPSYSEFIINKKYESKIYHKTYGTSKEEEEIYKLLCEKYGEVKRQYKSVKYPFACDFFIPSIDTYIEYQGFWTHGREIYNQNNPRHQTKLNLWKSKNKPQYIKAIRDWTERDPLKRKTAKDNGLNWIEFFSMKEFVQWLNINKS